MNPLTQYPCKKWSTVLGCFLLMFPLGVPWYWGNMSVYALSYVLKHLPSISSVEAPWVVPLYIIGSCVGVLLSAAMSRFLGKRFTIIFGILLFSAGWFGAYFAIQWSLTAMNLVIGLVLSVGGCVMDGTAILFAVDWCRHDVGMVSAIVQSGFPAGAIFINQFITLYVNPNNMLPDKQVGRLTYFTQDEVVNKVPSLFIIIACMALAVNTTGLLLIRQNTVVLKTAVKNQKMLQKTYGTFRSSKPRTFTISESRSIVLMMPKKTQSDSPNVSATPKTDLSPMQVFREPSLYLYWLCFFVGEVSYITMSNYYKSYGQLHIDDDHFLTNLSTALLVFITMSRALWGFMLDRYGLKVTFIINFTGSALTSLVFFFSPSIDIWCYVFATIIFGCVGSPVYSLVAYAALRSFGKYYFLFNYGLIMLPTIVTNTALPPLLQCLLKNLGWFYVFGFCSFCNVIGLIVVVFVTFPDKERK